MHVQREPQRCGMVKFAVVAARKVAQCVATPMQPPLQPPLQDKEAEQEDKASSAKDSIYAKCDDILEVALANELGLD